LTLKTNSLTWHDDVKLYQDALSGNANSAKSLVKKLSPKALALAFRMTQNMDVAQDCVQDAFMKLFYKSKFEGSAKISTYFHTIVSRNCLDYLKIKQLTIPLDSVEDSVLEEYLIDENIQIQTNNTLLEKALNLLSLRQRLAILLWAYDDATSNSIGEFLNIDENAANQLLFRAKANLKKELLRLGYE